MVALAKQLITAGPLRPHISPDEDPDYDIVNPMDDPDSLSNEYGRGMQVVDPSSGFGDIEQRFFQNRRLAMIAVAMMKQVADGKKSFKDAFRSLLTVKGHLRTIHDTLHDSQGFTEGPHAAVDSAMSGIDSKLDDLIASFREDYQNKGMDPTKNFMSGKTLTLGRDIRSAYDKAYDMIKSLS